MAEEAQPSYDVVRPVTHLQAYDNDAIIWLWWVGSATDATHKKRSGANSQEIAIRLIGSCLNGGLENPVIVNPGGTVSKSAWPPNLTRMSREILIPFHVLLPY